MISTVAVGTDGSGTAAEAVEEAAEIARRFEAKLVLLSAFSDSATTDSEADVELQWASNSSARVKSILERFEAELGKSGIDCEIRADEGDPADVLVRLADECGADLLVMSLIQQGAKFCFAYPGGASMPLHQALRKFRDEIRTVLPRHEQGGGFAAQGVSRSSDSVGVCMATSGPGATNLVTAIADAKLDSIPMVAVTGQVFQQVIGTDAFQETPIVEVCRGITKHHYLVTDVHDVPRIMKEAFHVATTGRPGPVLIDMPKDVQNERCVPDWKVPMNLPGYRVKARMAQPEQIRQMAAAIMMGIGEMNAILSGQVLLGQEAPLRIRGSVFGLAGIFGSLGILTANLLGGWLYDVWTKAAPFLVIGACNLLVLAFAVRVRLEDRRRRG